MKFTQKHEELLKTEGTTLLECQKLKNKDEWIAKHLLSYICGEGTPEQEELAEDLVTMITG